MCMIFLLFAFCALVNGDCDFRPTDSKDLQNKLKSWESYNKTFDVETDASKYKIGICSSLNPTDHGAIIQHENNTDPVILGKVNHASLVEGDNWVLLRYTDGERYNNHCGNETRSASIIFVCGQNTSKVTVVQENTAELELCNYLFQVEVPEMCAVVLKPKKNLSGGAIFFIILLCSASVYFIGGFLFMRLKRGSRGVD